jgi:hypothetical protein
MVGNGFNYVYDSDGHPRNPQDPAAQATARVVSYGYFGVLGISLLRGRFLDASDQSGASRVAVVNAQMANALWPSVDPIGKRLISVADERSQGVLDPTRAVTIVGVVDNTHGTQIDRSFDQQVYLPIAPQNASPIMYVLLHSRLPAAQVGPPLRHLVKTLDGSAAVTHIRPLAILVADSLSAHKSLTSLLVAFGILALVVCSLGVYSLMAYIVSWRKKEISIRLALGEPRWHVLRSIVRYACVLALLGSAAGIVITVISARVIRGFLFEVNVLDGATLVVAVCLMLAISAVAALAPARRAALTDPSTLLKSE